MVNEVLKTMSANNRAIKTSIEKYNTLVQDNIEIFLREYENSLSRNSKPLQNMFACVSIKDIAIIKRYMQAVSNIAFKVNNKGNLTITTTDKQPLKANDKITDKAWYELKVKVVVNDDFVDVNKMLSSFNGFYQKLVKSAEKLGLTQKTLNDIELLKGQLESYKA